MHPHPHLLLAEAHYRIAALQRVDKRPVATPRARYGEGRRAA
jgi:hypothetical protein